MNPLSGGFIPHYFQIRADILAKIGRGEIQEGDRISSENQLAKEYGVSRPTVRQALDELVFSGFLRREQGRGTFVAPKKITGDLLSYAPFVEEVTESGMQGRAKVLNKKLIQATDEVARLLDISSDSEIIEVIGLRLADGEPVTLRTSYYPYERFPDLLTEELQNHSMYETMRHYGIQMTRATQTFQVVQARELEAKYLEVDVGFPLILWEGLMYSLDNRPFELTRALYRSDRYEFRIEQYRNSIIGAGISLWNGRAPTTK